VAGAQVREMLVSAAADEWKIDRTTLKAENGMVIGSKGKKATYGQLAAAASKLPVPDKVALKDPKDFKIVGKPTRRLDTPSKVNGTAEFGLDVKLPGMLIASLEQCPVIGGTVKSFDAAKAKGKASMAAAHLALPVKLRSSTRAAGHMTSSTSQRRRGGQTRPRRRPTGTTMT